MNINQHAVLVRLTISTKGLLGERKDEGASETLVSAYNATDRKSIAGKVQLLNQNAKSIKRVKSTAHAIRTACVYRFCMTWGDRDSWLLPLNVRPKFEKEYAKLLADHNSAKENFFIDYPSLVRSREHDKELGGLFDASKYPPIDKIKSMFKCDILYSPVPVSGHFIANVTDEMKENLDRAVSSRVSEACNTLVDRVQKRLVEYVDTLAGYTGGREGRFNDSLVHNLADIGVLIKELNFTGDPAIEKLSTDVSRIVRFSTSALRSGQGTRNQAVAEGKTLLSRLETYKKLDTETDEVFGQMAEIEL